MLNIGPVRSVQDSTAQPKEFFVRVRELSRSVGGGTGVPAQVPFEQTSPVVQGFRSLHALAFGRNWQPFAGLQTSSVHALPSLQDWTPIDRLLLLLAVFGSGVRLEPPAACTIPDGIWQSIRVTSVKTVGPLETDFGRHGFEHVMVPLVPTAGVVQDQPEGPAMPSDTKYSSEEVKMLKLTFWAVVPPLLSSVMVEVSWLPARAGLGMAVCETARSACAGWQLRPTPSR